ncbi:HAD family hydrolase [Ruminococcus sp. NK3A76]|uniref:HAD family hydrolase n=1 Tax=Ruminococcus sp. NK3A76 TaxID=877411 RepID=UPI00048FF841|nr:HAD family hydrolase [Ruminococcus sp. NK3A76]
MRYKYVIFDLDGTILDTLDDLADAANAALASMGYPKRTKDEVRMFVGNGIRKLIERATPDGISEEDTVKTHEAFTAYYSVHCKDKTRPYEGIPELVSELKANGIRTAVVSNKADYAVKKLCEEYFGGIFDIAIGEREGIRKKPAPDSVLEVMRALGADAEHTIYIGDSDVDIMTAKNSGIGCIGVSYGFRGRDFLKEHGAEVIADTVAELRELLL